MCHKLYCEDRRPVAGAVVTCNVQGRGAQITKVALHITILA